MKKSELRQIIKEEFEHLQISRNVENFLEEKGWTTWDDIENEIERIREEFDLLDSRSIYDEAYGKFEEIYNVDVGEIKDYFENNSLNEGKDLRFHVDKYPGLKYSKSIEDDDSILNWTHDYFIIDHDSSTWEGLKDFLFFKAGWEVDDETAKELFDKMKPDYLKEDIIDYKSKLKNYFEKTNNTKRLESLDSLSEVGIIKLYNMFKSFINKK